MKKKFGLVLFLLLTAGLLCAEQIPLTTESALKSWTKTIQGVTLENGYVKIEPTAEDLVKGKGLLGIWKSVILKKYAGKNVILSAELMLKNVFALPNVKYSGTKFMIHFRKDGKVITGELRTDWEALHGKHTTSVSLFPQTADSSFPWECRQKV